jgi:transcriptional regulator with XRE-family HTH domain
VVSKTEESAADVLAAVLRASGMSKSAICARAGISRSSLDEYLQDRRQPSLAQIERIAQAADLRLTIGLRPRPRPVSSDYILVMELAEALPHDNVAPLAFPSMMAAAR